MARKKGKTDPISEEQEGVPAPAAQTVLRLMLINPLVTKALESKLYRIGSSTAGAAARIEAEIKEADTPQRLGELLPLAWGPLAEVWEQRLKELGGQKLPLLIEMLCTYRQIGDEAQRTHFLEVTLTVLYRHGQAAVDPLLGVWDLLDEHGKSMASVVLGILGARSSADRLWSFYRQVWQNREATYLVGPLWGLIDLGDRRADEALAELLQQGREFLELYPFLALAGGEKAMFQLMRAIKAAPQANDAAVWVAFQAAAQRLGPGRLGDILAEQDMDDASKAHVREVIEEVLSAPTSRVDEFLAPYQEIDAEMVRLLESTADIKTLLDDLESQQHTVPLPAPRSGEVKVYQFKVTLKYIRPPIWRRIQVLSDHTLGDLHLVLQVVMGWSNDHLHEFRIGQVSYGVQDPEMDWGGPDIDEDDVTLDQVVTQKGARVHYQYDFGDSWDHEIQLEKILDVEPGRQYPACITGKRACPPEDIGGVWGYVRFLETMANPRDPEYKEMREWWGADSFDPEAFDLEEVNARLRWADDPEDDQE